MRPYGADHEPPMARSRWTDCGDAVTLGLPSRWGRMRNRSATRRMWARLERIAAKRDTESRLMEYEEDRHVVRG